MVGKLIKNLTGKKEKNSMAEAQNAPSLTLSGKIEKATEQTINTIIELGKVLEMETKALKNADTQSFMQLQDDKLAAARKYEDAMKQMFERKDEIRNISAKMKARLSVLRAEFSETISENRQALKRMSNSTQRISNRIMSMAKKAAKEQQQFAYSSSGHMRESGKTTMGINESA